MLDASMKAPSSRCEIRNRRSIGSWPPPSHKTAALRCPACDQDRVEWVQNISSGAGAPRLWHAGSGCGGGLQSWLQCSWKRNSGDCRGLWGRTASATAARWLPPSSMKRTSGRILKEHPISFQPWSKYQERHLALVEPPPL